MNLHFKLFGRTKDAWKYRHEPEKMRVIAALYWRILLLLALCAAVGAFFFGVQAMGDVTQVVNTASATPPVQTPALDEGLLQSMLDAFAVRALQYQALASSSAQTISDPSQ